MIDQNDFGVLCASGTGYLFGLAAANEVARVGSLAAPRDRRDRLRTGRASEARELFEVLRLDRIAKPKSHEYSALTSARTFEHATFRIESSIGGGFGRSALFDRETYRPRRHDRRDCVLVDHLTDGVLEQYDELIKRVDLALQFDAIDEIDRNWNVFFAQRVQKRVL